MSELTAELVNRLNERLPEAAIKPHPSKTYMSTIKVIYMVERLNEVFGVNGWEDEYEVIENRPEAKMVVVRGKLSVPAYGIKRTAFGGNDNPDRGDAYKGACTDALSKMCSMLGIGMDVYKGDSEHPEPDSPEGKKQRRVAKQEAKKQYEAIHGVVTNIAQTVPGSIWLQVNGVPLRATEEVLITPLRDSMGKKIHVTAFWDFSDKQKKNRIMTINQVHGVYELVPGKLEGVPMDFNDEELPPRGKN